MKRRLIFFSFFCIALTITPATRAMDQNAQANNQFYIKHIYTNAFDHLEPHGNLKRQNNSFLNALPIYSHTEHALTFNCVKKNSHLLLLHNNRILTLRKPLNKKQIEGLRPYTQQPEYAKNFEVYYFLNNEKLILINSTTLPPKTYCRKRSASANSYFSHKTIEYYYTDFYNSESDHNEELQQESDSDSYSRGRSGSRSLTPEHANKKPSVLNSALLNIRLRLLLRDQTEQSPLLENYPLSDNPSSSTSTKWFGCIGTISMMAIVATCLLYSDTIATLVHG